MSVSSVMSSESSLVIAKSIAASPAVSMDVVLIVAEAVIALVEWIAASMGWVCAVWGFIGVVGIWIGAVLLE